MITKVISAEEYGAAIDRVFDNEGETKYTFQIHARSLKVGHGHLESLEAPEIVEAVALTLDALGIDDRQGMLIGRLHIESDPVRKLYRFSLCGIASYGIAKLLENLRVFPRFRDTENNTDDDKDLEFYDPIGERVIVKPLAGLAQDLPNLIQSCGLSRKVVVDQNGVRRRVDINEPIPEPLASQIEQWLEKCDPSELMLMIGIGETEDGLGRFYSFYDY